jgi:hypothetical protein
LLPGNGWALKMFDASSKALPSGFLKVFFKREETFFLSMDIEYRHPHLRQMTLPNLFVCILQSSINKPGISYNFHLLFYELQDGNLQENSQNAYQLLQHESTRSKVPI